MPYPVLVPIGIRLMAGAIIALAGALGFGLAKAANASNDAAESKIPVRDGPLNNVESRDAVFAHMREEIRKNPSLADGMSEEHKRRIGLTDDDLKKH